MPFTPFHLGAGAAIKATIPRKFSFIIFCFVQVVTDCETAYYIVTAQYPLHRWFHTYLGGTLVAVACVFIGVPLTNLVVTWLLGTRVRSPFRPISWKAGFYGALLGSYSHVLLDSIVHPDVHPFRPFTTANPFYGALSFHGIELLCLTLGLVGLVWLMWRWRGIGTGAENP